MSHDLVCYKENSFEELGLVAGTLVCLGLKERRAPVQIASSQEVQGLETAFGFTPVLNKSYLKTSKHFMRLSSI